ncbi:hypothetical protein L3Q82_003101 [Scortum barcoo]|uniref:Uncharacterized protein n=1 Tax=Scortum barcoo TaxID=214431 RepID=A0ACB8VS89_9TELE|nr:hypothetical protein L3Q82_003101 [Scortum barcoo]
MTELRGERVNFPCRLSLQGPHQRNLLKNLLKDYNRMERPVGNDSHPLTVFFTLSLIQIMDVSWFDHYLQWNQSEHPGVKNLRFTTDQVWTPDILLYNSADDDFDSTFKTNVLVNSSGYAEYLPPGYMANGEWDLIGVPGTRNEAFYDCCKEPYPDVTFVVTIRRRTLYYALNLLIPCVLLSSMTLLIFVLPADSGEKISLGTGSRRQQSEQRCPDFPHPRHFLQPPGGPEASQASRET